MKENGPGKQQFTSKGMVCYGLKPQLYGRDSNSMGTAVLSAFDLSTVSLLQEILRRLPKTFPFL